MFFLKPNSLYDITLPQINSSHPKNGWKPIGISEIPGVFSGAGRVPLVSGVKERTPGVKIGQLLCEAFWLGGN